MTCGLGNYDYYLMRKIKNYFRILLFVRIENMRESINLKTKR